MKTQREHLYHRSVVIDIPVSKFLEARSLQARSWGWRLPRRVQSKTKDPPTAPKLTPFQGAVLLRYESEGKSEVSVWLNFGKLPLSKNN